MDPRPLDSYQDVHPWPYEWHKEIHPSPTRALAALNFLFPFLDVWSYRNHWSYFGEHEQTKDEWITDIYTGDLDDPRQQLPLEFGDRLAAHLVDRHAQNILVILWNHHYWREFQGWQPWTGPQGDFVTHMHVEWKEYLWPEEE